MLKAAKAYLSTQVTTASQGDLLLMLYDTAIKHMRLAIEKMREGDVAAKGVLISKAIAIISELQESLNKERGGEISKNLLQLYFYCNTRLLNANLRMKPELLEEVIGILSGLRQAFAQILPSQEGVASVTQAAVRAEEQPQAPAGPDATSGALAAQDAAPDAASPVSAAPDETTPEAAPEAAAPAPPVNTMRLRAASAYAGAR